MKMSRLLFLAGIGLVMAVGVLVPVPTPVLAAKPTVTSVTPDQGLQGETADVTITGTDFTGATSVSLGPDIAVNSFVVNPGTGSSEVQVGSGSTPVTSPFVTYYHDSRTQSILLASEIGQSGEIQRLRLYCSTRPGQNLTHFYIRMQHTAMTSFTSTSFVNSGWTTVLHATDVNVSTWTVPGWVEFEFTTPFEYDWVSNLLIDYCVDNSSFTSSGFCYSTTATNRTLRYYVDLSSGDLLTYATGIQESWYNNVVLVMESMDQITANITIDGAATPGPRGILVTTPAGTDSLTNGFTVLVPPPPTITSVSPSEGIQGQTFDVTIRGSQFAGTTSVSFGPDITVNSFTVNSLTDAVGLPSEEVQVGSGTTPVTYPFLTYYRDIRTQSILLASEIGQSGEIQRLRLYCSTRPGQNLAHFYIRMQHTTMTSFTSTSFVNSGWTTVLDATEVNVSAWTVPGWVEFEFTTPFEYDGVSNLLIDYCVDNSSYTSSGYCSSTTATNRTLRYNYDLSTGDLLSQSTGTQENWYNNVVLVMENMDQIMANVTIDDSAAPGSRDVLVTTPAGTDNLTNGFTVLAPPPPTVNSVSPSEGIQGQTFDVTIQGSQFAGATSVSFGTDITVNSFTVNTLTDAVGLPSGEVQVGSGSTPVSYPFLTYYRDTRTQSILLASEIGQSGEIQRLRLYCSTRPGQNLAHFYIRMQHTTMTSFTSTSFVNGGWTTVLHATEVTVSAWTVPGWVEFEFTTPFEYDGASNLLIDYCIDNSSFTTSGSCHSTTATNRTLRYYYDLSTGDLLSQSTGTQESWYNNVVLVMDNMDNMDQITASITVAHAAVIGARDVSVTTTDGTAVLEAGFSIPCLVGGISPGSGSQGQTLTLIITGTNLNGASSVGLGSGITVNSFTVDTSSQITASITINGSAGLGDRDVSVTVAGGTRGLKDGFVVEPEKVSTLSRSGPLIIYTGTAVVGMAIVFSIAGTIFRPRLRNSVRKS